ncbi:MAG: hypothetical protein IJ938_04605, partial [Clostridia bacterium]|nr:hypothetical protein [Clostridia bacterium]
EVDQFIVVPAAGRHIDAGGDFHLILAVENPGRSDENNSATFLTYAQVVITRQMINAVKKGASINKITGKSDILIEDVEDIFTESDPFEQVLANDDWEKYSERLGKILSQFEYKAMMLYLAGETYRDIAKKLVKEVKSVDNAIARAKKKIAKDLDE